MTYDPVTNLLYTGSYKEVGVWDFAECRSQHWRPRLHLEGHGHWVYSLCFVRERLYTGAHNLLKVWRTTAPHECTAELRTTQSKSIYALELRGDLLVSVDVDVSGIGIVRMSIRMWHLR